MNETPHAPNVPDPAEERDETRDPGGMRDPAETLPELQLPGLRQRLFIAELERHLGDPVDFPPGETFDFDPIKVRLDRAVELIEHRAEELAGFAYDRSRVLRFAVALSALVGIGALVVALMLPTSRLFAWPVAVIELVLVLRFSKRSRHYAIDCLELRRVAERYRPNLDACSTADELRTLAGRMREEMGGLWIPPPPRHPA